MEYNVNNANVVLLSDNNLWCSAYPSLIIVGNIQNFVYIEKQFFYFTKTDVFTFYQALLKIIKEIAARNYNHRDILIQRDCIIYFWNLICAENKPVVIFGIESNLEVIFKISFSLEEFNDFILVFGQLIIPSLCFQKSIISILDFAASSSYEDIIHFTSTNKLCTEFLRKHQLDESCTVYLMYYKEILIITHKIKTLYNKDIKKYFWILF